MRQWTQLSTEVIHKNPWTEYRHDRFRLPNGKEGDYYYLYTPGAVTIIPMQADGRITLLRQYRYLFDRLSLELPGGGIKEGQTPDEALVAELAEEIGMRAGQTRLLGQLAPMNGLVDEFQTIYLTWDLSAVTATPDDTESFDLVSMLPQDVDEAIARGEIWDGFSVSCWALGRPHVMELQAQLMAQEESR